MELTFSHYEILKTAVVLDSNPIENLIYNAKNFIVAEINRELLQGCS